MSRCSDTDCTLAAAAHQQVTIVVGMAGALWSGLAIATQDTVGHLVEAEPFQARLFKHILCVFWIAAWLLA